MCDLIETKRPPGVFAILDDTCKAIHSAKGGEVDMKFKDKLDGVCGSNKHYKSFNKGFTVLHYAGDVDYNVKGFIK